MKIKFLSFLLSRYLFLSWMHKQKFKKGLASSTLIPICGVAVGVFSFIVVSAVMKGFVANIKSEIIQLTPHIEITPKNTKEIIANSKLINDLKIIDPKAVKDIAPFQSGDCIVQSESQATIVNLRGIEPSKAMKMINLSTFLVEGKDFAGLNDSSDKLPSVLIGRDLALQLNVGLGSVITLVSILFDEGFAPAQMPVTIAGIYDTGRAFLDSKIVYISIQNSNRFFATSNEWSGLQLEIEDPFHPESTVDKLNEYFLKKHANLFAQAWTAKNAALLKALFLENIGMMVVMAMIILVSCFSITISLLFSLHRKTRELAILRAIGCTQKDLSKLYLSHGFVIGLTGVIAGLIFGGSTLYLIHYYPIPLFTKFYLSSGLPVQIDIKDFLIISSGSVLLATFAAILPAFAVRRLNVVDVLAIHQ